MMSIRWLDEPAHSALARAVTEVEATSSVELVVAVRRAARAWLHVPLVVGVVAAWAALGFMLYSDHVFARPSFLVDPLLVGAVAGFAASLAPAMIRALTPVAIRRRAVERAARATFYERGIHRTRGRTGVLVYCALTERMAAVVVDTAVEVAIPGATLDDHARRIERALGSGGAVTAAAIGALAPAFAKALPRDADDKNELADAIDHDLVRRPRS